MKRYLSIVRNIERLSLGQRDDTLCGKKWKQYRMREAHERRTDEWNSYRAMGAMAAEFGGTLEGSHMHF